MIDSVTNNVDTDFYESENNCLFPKKKCYACKSVLSSCMNRYYIQDKCFCSYTCRKMYSR